MARKVLIVFLMLLVLPFWFLARFIWVLFAKIVDLVGIKELRREGNKIQTPIVYFEHPETQKSVIFIGMSHIAEKEYFSKVKYFAEKRKAYGDQILYEYTDKLRDETVNTLGETAKELHKQTCAYSRLQEESANILGVEYQKNWIRPGIVAPDWVNNDISEWLLIILFEAQELSFWKNAVRAAENLPKDEKEKIRSRWLLDRLFAESAAGFLAIKVYCFLFNIFHRRQDALCIILDYRNKIAMRAIKRYLKDGNVVNIWGSAHLRGIGKMLEQEGFIEMKTEWITAYHVHDYSFWEALGTFFKSPKTAS